MPPNPPTTPPLRYPPGTLVLVCGHPTTPDPEVYLARMVGGGTLPGTWEVRDVQYHLRHDVWPDQVTRWVDTRWVE